MLVSKIFLHIYLFSLIFSGLCEQKAIYKNRIKELKHSYHRYKKEAKQLHQFIRYKQKCINKLNKGFNLDVKYAIPVLENNTTHNWLSYFVNFIYKDATKKDSNYYKAGIIQYQNDIIQCKKQIQEMDEALKCQKPELRNGISDSKSKLMNSKQGYYLQKKMNIKQLRLLQKINSKPLQELMSQAQNNNRMLSAQLLQNPGMSLPVQYQTRLRVQAGLPQNQTGLNPEDKRKLEEKFTNTKQSFQEIKDSISQYKLNLDSLPFKPNPFRGMPFKDRIEKNFNWQAGPSNKYFPGILDFSLGMGYKVSPKLTPQVGILYKLGLGKNLESISISSQGFGLKGGASYMIYKSALLFTSYEQTYYKNINPGSDKSYQAMPAFILGVGLKGKITMLVGYDFLQKLHPEKGSAWVLRFGV